MLIRGDADGAGQGLAVGGAHLAVEGEQVLAAGLAVHRGVRAVQLGELPVHRLTHVVDRA